jgi:hypothetical protein
MKFIGLDVAATTGYAFIAADGRSNHWELGTVKADSPQKHDILAFAKEHGATHAVLEQPVPMTGMRGGKAGNHGTTQISMGRSMGRWEEACEMAGLVVVPVYVASWQHAMLVVNGQKLSNKAINGDCEVLIEKPGSMLIARSLGAHPSNGDEADAVCLCAYGPTALKRAECEALEKKMIKAAKARARRKK